MTPYPSLLKLQKQQRDSTKKPEPQCAVMSVVAPMAQTIANAKDAELLIIPGSLQAVSK